MRRRAVTPLVVPCALAAAYLVLLVVQFPQLVGWENTDSDISSAYVLADAISHGHTGQVVMSTQGSWVPLWYGLLTHGMSFHRVLWEISPALLVLVTALLIGWSVARLSTRLAGLLTVGIILAASPVVLTNLTAAFDHNTTIPGVAILGAYLVWLNSREHAYLVVAVATFLTSVIVGTFLASDALLWLVGLLPFVGVSLAFRVRTRDPTNLIPVLVLAIGAAIAAVITAQIMKSLDFIAVAPIPRPSLTLIPEHFRWLVQGLLRMGNGLSVAPHSPSRTPLVVVAAIATLGALGAMFWLAIRRFGRPAAGDLGRACNLHTTFWAGSFLCAAAAYVGTTVATLPTDRYFIVAVPAVAATVPLLLTTRAATWITAVGASVFITASIVALASSDERGLVYRGIDARVSGRIESLVQSQHLGIGFAGYWDAENLDWITREHLHVYPVSDTLTGIPGEAGPMYLARVAAWYRSRPETPSYVLLVADDAQLADRLPPNLPSPAREVHVGPVTMAIYPYDIASHLHPSPTALASRTATAAGR